MRMKRKDKFDWIFADLVKAYHSEAEVKLLLEMDKMRKFTEDMNIEFIETSFKIFEPVIRRETSAVVDKVVAKRFDELRKRMNGSLQIQNRLYMQRFIDADMSMMKEVRDAHNNMVHVWTEDLTAMKRRLNDIERDLTIRLINMDDTLDRIQEWQQQVHKKTADVMSALMSEVERQRPIRSESPAYVEAPSGEIVPESPPPQRDWTFPTAAMVASGWLDENQIPEDMHSLIPVSNVRSMSSISSLSSVEGNELEPDDISHPRNVEVVDTPALYESDGVTLKTPATMKTVQQVDPDAFKN
ncbi:hypothetical protein FRC02_007554 [Tulasnella sp. 418]|nr:hypothetical protein FRC02_007554 [Tulasnella sp. 418]